MLKKHPIILLSTTNKTNLIANMQLDLFVYTDDIIKYNSSYIIEFELKYYHIYFISNEPIQKNDWFYNTIQKCIYKNDIENYDINKEYLKKIIASTNPDLNIPIIPITYIKYFCDVEGEEEINLHYENESSLKIVNNEICFSPIKTSWNRAEVIKLCQRCWLKQPNTDNMIEEFLTWVDNNLV